jgi:D-alanyl-D-alanine carboxypeptidase
VPFIELPKPLMISGCLSVSTWTIVDRRPISGIAVRIIASMCLRAPIRLAQPVETRSCPLGQVVARPLAGVGVGAALAEAAKQAAITAQSSNVVAEVRTRPLKVRKPIRSGGYGRKMVWKLRACLPAAVVTAVVLAALVGPALGVAATEHGSAAAKQRAAKVSAAVREVMAKLGIPGVIVGVWQRGEVPIVKAFGSRTVDLAAGKVGPPNMKAGLFMRIGSETKTFTATAVLQLVGEGRVGLEDPISKYVRGVPNGNSITVRELGEMRSGLVDFSNNEAWEAEYLAAPTRAWAPRQLLAASFSLPPPFAPGQGYEYSNTNFVLLGLLVEKVSGKRIGTYVERHILAPLQLEDTLVPAGLEFPKPHADGYTLEPLEPTLVNATRWNFSWAWSTGTMISKLGDLRIWAKAVATGTLLKSGVQRQRERFLPIPGSPLAGYGFGLFDVNGWIGHDGAVPGFESLTVYLPSKQATMVILLNSDAEVQSNTILGEAVSRVITPGHLFAFGPTPAVP